MSSRQSVHKWSKFQDSVHRNNWHIASYCCFVQTAPTLDSTYIKNEIRKTFFWQKAVEGLLFNLKLPNLRHRPFGTFALTPRCTTWLRRSSLKLQGSKTSRHPFWRSLGMEAAWYNSIDLDVELRRHYLGWNGFEYHIVWCWWLICQSVCSPFVFTWLSLLRSGSLSMFPCSCHLQKDSAHAAPKPKSATALAWPAYLMRRLDT